MFSFGWTPIIPGSSRSSLSMKNSTLCSLSFNRPKGVTDPGFKLSNSKSSFSLTKLSGLVLFWCLNSFKSTFFVPFTVIK